MQKVGVKQVLGIATSVIRYKLGRSQPFFVNFQITTRCNCKCLFCDVWKQTIRELDTRQAKQMIDNMSDCGIREFGITGGEPLLRRDLEEIADQAKKKLDCIVGLSTNATLIDAERAKKLTESFDIITISLDGFEATHDEIRQAKGTYKKALSGLQRLLEADDGCNVGINYVFTNKNYKEFFPFFKFIREEYGVKVALYPVAGFSSLAIPKEEVDAFISGVRQRKSEDPAYLEPSELCIDLMSNFVSGTMPRICDAGKLYLGLAPNGELRICPLSPITPRWKIGSVLHNRLVDLIKSDEFKAAVERSENCSPCFVGCTTPISVEFRSSFLNLAREGFRYYKASKK